jgi:hypothetical protein
VKNLKIYRKGNISNWFLDHSIDNFWNAFEYVKHLKYGRISDKQVPFLVLIEKKGTCSSKHNLLKMLADENEYDEIILMICIFKMNSQNTPEVSNILQKYDVDFIPEAHNFLMFNNKVFDATMNFSSKKFPTDDIIISKPVLLAYNIKHKEDFHKEYIHDNSKMWKYTPEKMWSIRDKAINSIINNKQY